MAPDESFSSDEEMIEYFVDYADVNELVQSILASGWLDYEPLIVLDGENIVLEGNRRLTALRILKDAELRARLKIDLGEEPMPSALPSTVRIRRVRSRSDARAFVGFKHINGPFKWDALAKAKYAAEWIEEDPDIRRISRCLGDSHNTVVRLVNGWNVLDQSLSLGFDFKKTTRARFAFSHLYTGLARPNVRRYLALKSDVIAATLRSHPVPDGHHDRLQQFMSWLYGQSNEPAVIRTQNPDLNRLVEVLGNDNARTMLEATRDLDAAYDQAEDKDLRFSQTLMRTIKEAEGAFKLVPHYDGRADLMSAGNNLRRTALALHAAMKHARERAEAGDATDAD